MPRNKLGIAFVQEFVIGFGFFSGLWIYVGVDPEAQLAEALLSVLKAISPSMASNMSILFWVIPIIMTIGSIVASLLIGGWLGLVAVFLAFLGGVFIGSIGVWLLLSGVVLGFVAPYLKKNES